MSMLKGYFTPAREDAHQGKKSEKAVEMSESPRMPISPQLQQPQAPAWRTAPSSPYASRPGSVYPVGDFRNAAMEEINEIKCDVMVNWLHSQQEEKLWTTGEPEEGVVLKMSRGKYTCSPPDLAYEPVGFFKAVETLNVRVCVLNCLHEPC
jgi:hypothetical protein